MTILSLTPRLPHTDESKKLPSHSLPSSIPTPHTQAIEPPNPSPTSPHPQSPALDATNNVETPAQPVTPDAQDDQLFFDDEPFSEPLPYDIKDKGTTNDNAIDVAKYDDSAFIEHTGMEAKQVNKELHSLIEGKHKDTAEAQAIRDL